MNGTMTKMRRGFNWAILAGWMVGAIAAGAQIDSVTRLTARPKQFEKAEFQVMLKGHWANPYRQWDARLDAEFVAPSHKVVIVPGFFERGQSGALSEWRVRWTPLEAGQYLGKVAFTNQQNLSESSTFWFFVEPSKEKGFLRTNNLWSFRFDNGTPFRGLGENIGWEPRQPEDLRYNYEYLLGRLSENGGNFFRTWMCSWNLELEPGEEAAPGHYTNNAEPYSAAAIQRMDELVNLSESLDLYMMLTLNAAVDYSGEEWGHSAYNKRNGGFAETPQDFFTNKLAKAQFKNRLRYIVARWGYSPHVAVWELFNEVDELMHAVKPNIPDADVTAWHAEMAKYLKSIDPEHRFVTTSISYQPVAGLNEIASMDFNQLHIYGHNGVSRVASFPEALRDDTKRDGKPVVIGEYGYEWDWNKNFETMTNEINGDFKKGLWLGLFSPTPILPMSWWWEYLDAHKQTPLFREVGWLMSKTSGAGDGNIEEAGCDWDGPEVTKLAVKAGNRYFVLLLNNGSDDAVGTLTMPKDARIGPCIIAHGDKTKFDDAGSLSNERKLRVTATAHDGSIVIIPDLNR